MRANRKDDAPFLPALPDISPGKDKKTGKNVGYLVGATIGLVGGLIFAATLNQSMAFYAIGGAAIGALIFAAYEQLRSQDGPSKTVGAGGVILALLAGGVAGFMFNGMYLDEIPDASTLQSAVAFFLGGGVVFGIVYLWIDWYNDSIPDDRQRNINVDPEYNYKGNRIHGYLHLLGPQETSVELAERPPLVQYWLMAGYVLIGLAVLYWFYQDRPGWDWWSAGVTRKDSEFIFGSIIVGGLVLIWLFASIRYNMRMWATASTTADETNKVVKRTGLSLKQGIFLLSIAVVFSLWGLLGFPWWDSVKTTAQTDPSKLLLLVIIPLSIWNVLLFLVYLTSYTILTNLNLYCGSTLQFVPGTFKSRMPRSKMANSDLRGGLRRLPGLRYWILKREGLAQEDRFWQKLPAKHGKQLDALLSGTD